MANNTLVGTLFDEFGAPTRRQRTPSGGPVPDPVVYSYDERGNRAGDERGSYNFNARDQLIRWTRGSTFDSASATKAGSVVRYDLGPAIVAKPGDPGSSYFVPNGSVLRSTDEWRPVNTISDTVTLNEFSGERLVSSAISQRRSGESVDDTAVTSYHHNAYGSVIQIDRAQSGPTPPPASADNDAGGPASATCAVLPARISATSTSYCFDEFDRLINSRGEGVGDDQALLTYDALDRRDVKSIPQTGGGAVKLDFSYVGTSPATSRQARDDGGTNTLDYTAGGEAVQILQRPAGGGAPSTRVYATDSNRSVTGLEAADGTVAASDRYVYDPYGELDNETSNEATLGVGARDNPFRFQGFLYDQAIKSYDMQARNYRPDAGRFLQQDKYEAAGADTGLITDPLTQNRYAFAAANPVTNIEFDGHRAAADGNNGPGLVYGRKTTRRDKQGQQRIASQRGPSEQRSAEENLDHQGYVRKTAAFYGTPDQRPHAGPAAADRDERSLLSKGLDAGLDFAGFERNQDCPLIAAATNCALVKPQGDGLGEQIANTALAFAPWGRAAHGLGALGTRAATKAGRGGIGPVRLGQAGEDAVRGAYDIGPKATRVIGGRTRIFDGLVDDAVSEVKNVKSLSYTQQLKDGLAYAQQSGRRFDLYVRGGADPTSLSGPLADAIRNGDIGLRYIP